MCCPALPAEMADPVCDPGYGCTNDISAVYDRTCAQCGASGSPCCWDRLTGYSCNGGLQCSGSVGGAQQVCWPVDLTSVACAVTAVPFLTLSTCSDPTQALACCAQDVQNDVMHIVVQRTKCAPRQVRLGLLRRHSLRRLLQPCLLLQRRCHHLVQHLLRLLPWTQQHLLNQPDQKRMRWTHTGHLRTGRAIRVTSMRRTGSGGGRGDPIRAPHSQTACAPNSLALDCLLLYRRFDER